MDNKNEAYISYKWKKGKIVYFYKNPYLEGFFSWLGIYFYILPCITYNYVKRNIKNHDTDA